MTTTEPKEAARETMEHLETMTSMATELCRWWFLRGFTKDRWLHFCSGVWHSIEKQEAEKKAGKA